MVNRGNNDDGDAVTENPWLSNKWKGQQQSEALSSNEVNLLKQEVPSKNTSLFSSPLSILTLEESSNISFPPTPPSSQDSDVAPGSPASSAASSTTGGDLPDFYHPQLCRNQFSLDPVTTPGLHNLLRVPTSNPNRGFLTRQCCYVFHVLQHCNTPFKYPFISNKTLLKDDRIISAIERTATTELEERDLDQQKQQANGKAYAALIATHTSRVKKILREMKSSISTLLLRLTAWTLFRVFGRLLQGVAIHGGQLERIEAAAAQKKPIIFLPLHRSHMDYLLLTFILVNRDLSAPLVAAGDNLRMPIFGSILRGLGGFFIKRRLEEQKGQRDVLYRAVLQTYITHVLEAGYNLEFFIEGGRTRTGKPCVPKGGLLSVIVDAYISRSLEDALIVPMAINYDKLVDGHFITEQMGQSKVPESFWGAVRAIWTVFSTNYGHVRVDFGAPFSLREFVQTYRSPPPASLSITPPRLSPPRGVQKQLPLHHSGSSPSLPQTNMYQMNQHRPLDRTRSQPSTDQQQQMSSYLVGARSNSSLFGNEVTDDFKLLVRALATHVIYDAEKCSAVMATNAVAYLLLTSFRGGASVDQLSQAVQCLTEELRVRGRDVGFTGSPRDVVQHAVELLSPSMVRRSVSDEGEERIVPLTDVPNVIELQYYSNTLAPLFALDAIVVTSLLSLLDVDLWSYRDQDELDITLISRDALLEKSLQLASILNLEFVLAPSCVSLYSKLNETVDQVARLGLLSETGTRNHNRWSEDSDDEDSTFTQYFKVNASGHVLDTVEPWLLQLAPLLDAYYMTVRGLRRLVGRQMNEKEFVKDTQSDIRERLEDGTLLYGECVAADSVRNALRMLEGRGVVESFTQGRVRTLFLSAGYDSERLLGPLLKHVDSFRS